jgi:hypothetical protein
LFLRWGNFAVAKLTEFLFNTTLLTDMGCTLRLFRRDAMRLMRPHLTIGTSHFGCQLLMEVVAHRIPFVEIPVNYRARVGESSVTGDFWKAFGLGMQMIAMVLGYRFGVYRRNRLVWSERPDAARDLAILSKAIAVTSRSRQDETADEQEPERQHR